MRYCLCADTYAPASVSAVEYLLTLSRHKISASMQWRHDLQELNAWLVPFNSRSISSQLRSCTIMPCEPVT